MEYNRLIEKPKNMSSLVTALAEIVIKVMTTDAPTVDILSLDKIESQKLTVFKIELLKLTSSSSSILHRIETASKATSNASSKFSTKRGNSVILFETFEEFKEIFKRISPETHFVTGYYAVAMINGELRRIQEIFDAFWRLQMFNVIIVFEDNFGIVQIKTFMPFTQNACDDTTPIRINQFKKGKFVNGIENMFPDKMQNLHKCPIRVATSNESVPFVNIKYSENGAQEWSGRDIDLIETLAECLNFTIDFTYVGREGHFYENGSVEGPLRALLDRSADLAIADLWLKLNRLTVLSSTVPYFVAHIVLAIPPGREYSTFQKLIYPFKWSFWMAIVLCFLIAIIVIFIINLFSKNIQSFVFGHGVQHPYLNLYVGFIGSPQRKLPKTNFARYLLMMLLIYALIIRTAYQSSFYNLLQTNDRHKEVQTIDEMIDRDFTFYIFDYMFDLFKDTEKIANR